VNGFIIRYILIKLIRVFYRAVFYTGSTTSAFIFYNVSGLFGKGYLKVTRFSFHTVNFSIGQDFYIWMPADLDQFR